MADDAPTLERLADGSGFRVRVRYGKERARFRIPSTDEDFARARERAAVLVSMGAALGSQPPELAHSLLTRAGAADGRELAKIQAAVRQLSEGAKVTRKAVNPASAWTVRELGEAWTKGTLAKDYPDHVKPLRAKNAASRLKGHVYPVIGETRVRDVTLADVERVMASLTGKRPTQRKLSALTRRTISLTLNRLLNIAVYPLKIIPVSPIPKGLVPKAGKRRAMAYLYPDEDRALMAHASIPIAERAFWGFLCREGCRVSEALAMRWTDFDLERGAVRLDKNKTDDPRAWALSPGVATALKAIRPKDAAGFVFPQPADPLSLAENLRARLVEAGVDRVELHRATPERMALRAHDLRGSFVTIAFAAGRSESWVADRTGHRSSQMLARYKRQARTAAELELGDWTPLDVALGLAKPSTPPGPRGAAKRGTAARGRRGARDSKRDRLAPPIRFERTTLALGIRHPDFASYDRPKSSEETLYPAAENSPVPDLSQPIGQSSSEALPTRNSANAGAVPAPVPTAPELRAELERATAAGDWARVAELARALAERDN